jgi:hypothetical protein
MWKRLRLAVIGLLLQPALMAVAADRNRVDDTAALVFGREVSMRVLTFRQGDRNAFKDVNTQFTSDAWALFLKDLTGWVAPNGAPTFSSEFAPNSDGHVVDEQHGIAHIRIPGMLTERQNESKTTYRIAVDVWVGGTPLLVHRLTQTTCLGASKACE